MGNETISVYSEKIGFRKRQLAKSNVCSQFEEQAKRRSRHGVVYIAHGVRCDMEEKLKNIIDHLHSEIHQAALDARKYKELCDRQDQNHPLVRILKKQEQTTVGNLIKLAIDVYNDSKLLTPSAWSWPARALATAHADQLISSMNENGLQGPFIPFEPSSTDLHYRDPNIYKEMLTTITELEKEKLKDEVNTAIKFSTQIDGSVDTMQRDNKFLFLKYNSPDDPLEIKTRFVGVTDSDLKGAAGLEDCVLTGLKTIEVDKLVMKKKYAGVTTDGEAANTGSKSELWKRLEDHVERKLMNFWCACHRSDLAMEDMEESVPELKVWKSNLLSIPEYYHKSVTRTKELKKVLPTMKAFPTYHNVWFSQHLNNVCIAILHNQVGCLQHWDNISKSRDYDARGKGNVLMVSLSCGKRMEYSHISLALCLMYALCFRPCRSTSRKFALFFLTS